MRRKTLLMHFEACSAARVRQKGKQGLHQYNLTKSVSSIERAVDSQVSDDVAMERGTTGESGR